MTYIDESDDNIELNVFDNGHYINVEATFKTGDPYLFECKGKSSTLGRETFTYHFLNIGDSFETRFEKCINESVNRLIADYRSRSKLADHNLNIKLTDKANNNKKLTKYILE
jgi:hypothetical protein